MPLSLPKKLLTIAALSLALSAGLGVLGWQRMQPKASERATLAPAELHEACFDIAPTTRLEYAFETSHAAQFNLHYHEGEDILFPLPEHLTQAEQSSFTPESKQVYCLMWTNTSSKTLELALSYQLHRR